MILFILLPNSCKKDKPSLPILTTSDVSKVTQTTANSGGNITKDGGATILSRGVCWGPENDPTLTDNKTSDSLGIGRFSSNITGLSPKTTYFVRAYATNSSGTAYGIANSFTTDPSTLAALSTTPVSSITQITATSGGVITSDGAASIIAKGVCWSTTQNPTISDSITSDGSGTESFTSTISRLIGNTMYYVRAYATNNVGTEYGNQVSFKTSPLIPTLTTTTGYEIWISNYLSGGNISSDGGAPVTARGVCWSTSENPTIANDKSTDGTGIGIFESGISGLIGDKTYFIRAYATNSVGTGYGNQVSFKTSPSPPFLTTKEVFPVSASWYTSGGNISSDGGAPVTVRGVCWSTSENPTVANDKSMDGSGTGIFESGISGLIGDKTYFIRAYATNSVGTGYGNQVSFKTSPWVPIPTTVGISEITMTSSRSGGNISSDGGTTVTARGVCWSTSANPTIENSKTTDGTGTGLFTSYITGLTSGTIYYVRAYATNSSGTGYSGQIIFNTLFDPLGHTGTVYDVEGNGYNIITIGTQAWIAENLKTTKYNDGTSIPVVTNGAAWGALYTPGYCWYNNEAAYKVPYGALYNWYAVNTGKLCPTGWHLPSDVEWTTLTTYVGGESVAGDKLKSTSYWVFQHAGTTNEFGFNAYPGCKRFPDGTFTGKFTVIGWDGNWWSNTELDLSSVYGRYMITDRSEVFRTFYGKKNGLSVRCIKDD